MTTATWLQQNCNDDVSILRNIISENKHRIMKSESKEAENKFSLNINKQLTKAMLWWNELRKKQKLTVIQSEIEILQVVETMKKKSSSFHLSSHEEFKWSTHYFHSVDEDETKSSQDCFAEVKILNIFKEVSWQNHQRT